MTAPLLTHKDLAVMLGVSETTVKSYRRKFPGCIPVANEGKPIRFAPEAGKVAVRIRDLFSSGMSVKDVRYRLASEFSWISAKPPKPEKNDAPRAGAKAHTREAAPELTVGVSNMAKSMVSMSQQQKDMAKRMQAIEACLGELGLTGAEAGKTRQESAEAARRKEEFLERRLDVLDAVTRRLAESVDSLTTDLGRFLATRSAQSVPVVNDNAVESRPEQPVPSSFSQTSQPVAQERPKTASSMRMAVSNITASQPGSSAGQSPMPPESGKAMEQPAAQDGPPSQQPAPQRSEAQVIPLRPHVSRDAHPVAAPDAPVEEAQTRQHIEPPRHFFSLPLVVRTVQGQTVSADGRARGRFCLNDLKAVLASQGFSPSAHHAMQWQAHGQGWWLTLEQPSREDSAVLRILLIEVGGRAEGNVVAIVQLQENGHMVHPTAFARILESFTS